MKRLIIVAIAILLLITVGFGQSTEQSRLQAIAVQNNLPLYGQEDFNKYTPNVTTKVTAYRVDSPFFKDDLPFTYIRRELALGGGMGMDMKITDCFIFDGYTVFFKNDGPMVNGACATDGDRLLAEAVLF